MVSRLLSRACLDLFSGYGFCVSAVLCFSWIRLGYPSCSATPTYWAASPLYLPRPTYDPSRRRTVTQPEETGSFKAKSLPRMFPGRNTRMLMMKDPSQYSPRFRYLFLGLGNGGVTNRCLFPSLRALARAQGPPWAPQLWVPPSFVQDRGTTGR